MPTKPRGPGAFDDNAVGPVSPDDVVAPEGPVTLTDPALESWANFTVTVGSAFTLGSGAGQNGYNREAHRYARSYIRPDTYQITLDATIGLQRNLST